MVEDKQEKNDLVVVYVVVVDVDVVVASYLLKLSHGVLVGRFLRQGPANAAGVHRREVGLIFLPRRRRRRRR